MIRLYLFPLKCIRSLLSSLQLCDAMGALDSLRQPELFLDVVIAVAVGFALEDFRSLYYINEIERELM